MSAVFASNVIISARCVCVCVCVCEVSIIKILDLVCYYVAAQYTAYCYRCIYRFDFLPSPGLTVTCSSHVGQWSSITLLHVWNKHWCTGYTRIASDRRNYSPPLPPPPRDTETRSARLYTCQGHTRGTTSVEVMWQYMCVGRQLPLYMRALTSFVLNILEMCNRNIKLKHDCWI